MISGTSKAKRELSIGIASASHMSLRSKSMTESHEVRHTISRREPVRHKKGKLTQRREMVPTTGVELVTY